MEQIFFILFLLVLGNSLKFFEFPQNFSQSLNLFVIYISFPATILLQIPKIQFDATFFITAATPYAVLLLSLLFLFTLFKDVPKNIKASLFLLLPLGNTSFFGFPMLEALAGKESIAYGIVYDQFGSFILLALYGSFIVAYFSGTALNTKQVAKKIATFPPVISLIIAFSVGEFPSSALPYIELLSHTLVPLAIISVGFTMQLRLDEDRDIFVRFMLIKLIAIPAVFFGIFKIFGFGGIAGVSTLLESAMPPMITAGALAINAGFAPKLTASLVGYGIIFAVVTLSMFEYLFTLVLL